MRRNKISIPKLGEKLLSLIVPASNKELLIGDFEEYYIDVYNRKGKFRANLGFCIQFLMSTPPFIWQSIKFQFTLLKHSIKVAFRNITNHFGHSMLNLLGLSIGIACFIIIMLYVEKEKSYDQFHSKADRIYRVLDFRKINGIGEESSSAPTPLAEFMKLDFPEEIESAVRFFNFQAPTLALSYKNSLGEVERFNEPNLFFVDKTFFQVFDFSLIEGDSSSALYGPNKIVLTSSMAKKYFGREDPMGAVIRFEGKHNLVVSGIIEDPQNSHLNFDFLVSFETLDNPEVMATRLRNSWIWNPSWTYLLLGQNIEKEDLEARFPDFVVNHFPESAQPRVKLHLQPLKDIHLHSKLDYEMHPNSDIVYIYIFSTIAFFVLIISYVNFINLTTASASMRHKEIGVRKVLGGNRTQLIWQILSESILMNFIAVMLSLPIIWLFLYQLSDLTGKDLVFTMNNLPWALWQIITVYLGASILSGIYPAYFLSSFSPVQGIKGTNESNQFGVASIRKLMVVGQFTLSIVLIIGTMVASNQFNFLRNRTLGIDSEKVVLLPTLRSPLMKRYKTFKQALLNRSEIKSMTTVEDVPGMKFQTGSYQAQEGGRPEQLPRLIVHDDFIKTMGIKLIAGRDFQEVFQSDAKDATIINETLAKQLGWVNPEAAVGRIFDQEHIIGVTEDFHFTSLHNQIGPFVMERVADDEKSLKFSARYIAVRVDTENIDETLTFIRDQWMSFVPDTPFEYHFLDSLLATQYTSEETLERLTGVFSALSILIACMGLYGLCSFTVQRKIKDIGIRKVMGASVINLVVLLSSSFLKMVGIAILLAWPIAYIALNRWLENFAYKINLDIFPFVGAGILALIIAILTIGYQTVKSSYLNPVETLKCE